MWEEACKTVKSIAVVGDTRTGKTGFVYSILKNFDKPVYFFKHPKVELIEALGFKNIQGLGEIEKLQDCVIWIDEPQLFITLHERKANLILRRLLSLCGQRGITLIISTAETRFITRGLESYIDIWIVKDLEFDTVKQGSRIKKIIKDTVYISEDGFSLEINEYIFWSRKKDYKKNNRIHQFDKPSFFTEELSKPFKIATKTPTEIAKVEQWQVESMEEKKKEKELTKQWKNLLKRVEKVK